MKKEVLAQRLFPLLLVVCLFFCLITASLASGIDADHECMGEHCCICLGIALREQIKVGLFVLTAVLFVLSCLVYFKSSVTEIENVFNALRSPVCLRVKLLN